MAVRVASSDEAHRSSSSISCNLVLQVILTRQVVPPFVLSRAAGVSGALALGSFRVMYVAAEQPSSRCAFSRGGGHAPERVKTKILKPNDHRHPSSSPNTRSQSITASA